MSVLRQTLLDSKIEFRDHGVNVGYEDINIACPFHGEVNHYHCGIHEKDLYFHCFACGEKGTWSKLKKKLKEAYPNVDWDVIPHNSKEFIQKPTAPKTNPKLPIYWRPVNSKDELILKWLVTKPPLSMLKEIDRPRGLDLDVVEDCGLMIGTDRLNGYVVFNDRGNINARKYYKNSPGPRWWKRWIDRPYLFGDKWVAQRKPDTVVITEGIFDCLRLPLGYGLALNGATAGNALLLKIKETCKDVKKVILALDKDAQNVIITRLSMLFKELGYEVEVFDWNAIKDPNIKDLDELYLTTNNKNKFLDYFNLAYESDLI